MDIIFLVFELLFVHIPRKIFHILFVYLKVLYWGLGRYISG